MNVQEKIIFSNGVFDRPGDFRPMLVLISLSKSPLCGLAARILAKATEICGKNLL